MTDNTRTSGGFHNRITTTHPPRSGNELDGAPRATSLRPPHPPNICTSCVRGGQFLSIAECGMGHDRTDFYCCLCVVCVCTEMHRDRRNAMSSMWNGLCARSCRKVRRCAHVETDFGQPKSTQYKLRKNRLKTLQYETLQKYYNLVTI